MKSAEEQSFSLEVVAGQASQGGQESVHAQMLDAILSASADHLYVNDRQGRCLYIGAAAAAALKLDRQTAIGKTAEEVGITPEFASFLQEEREQVIRTGTTRRRETICWMDGKRRYFECTFSPLFDEEEIVAVLCAARDVTERKESETLHMQMEAALRERIAEIETIMETIPAAIWIAGDPECKRIVGNRTSYDFLRMAPESNVSKSAPAEEFPTQYRVYQEGRELLPHEHPMQRAAAEGREMRGVQQTLVFPDGTEREIYGNASPLFDAAGKVRGAVAAFVDITEHKATQDAILQEQEKTRALVQQLQFLLDNAPVLVTRVDSQGRYRFVNKNYAAYYGSGWTAEEIVGRHFREVVGEATYQNIRPHWEQAFAGQIVTYDLEVPRPNGPSTYLRVTYAPERDENGTVHGTIGVMQDITEQKRAAQRDEEHLAEIEEINRRLRRAMAETHHRVKNNLQIISALAEVQIDPDNDLVPTTALQRMSHHARSLATIHDLLTQEVKAGGDTDFISTQALLEKLVPLLRMIAGERQILASAANLRLSLRQGASLALLINELVGNAIKHGAGDIEITLRVEGEIACLEVADQGPGFGADFDPGRAANTGLSLIDSTGRYDLRGTVTFGDRSEGGGRVQVRFPVQNGIDA